MCSNKDSGQRDSNRTKQHAFIFCWLALQIVISIGLIGFPFVAQHLLLNTNDSNFSVCYSNNIFPSATAP